jgi:hypothetical protein
VSVEELTAALNALDEPTSCEGTHPLAEPLALMLPDGDVAALADPRFVDWLLAHAELAPFGEGFVTRVDPGVRNVQRVTGRHEITVAGFDPAAILPAIEAALSSSVHLSARLTDVLVYSAGGKFVRHRDTPYTRDLVGTLVVGLPIAHTGGAFVVDDGTEKRSYDWGAPITNTVRWAALFSDVDHEVCEVTTGARVTLVYALDSTYVPRPSPPYTSKIRTVRAAIDNLDLAGHPLMIACARHVITGKTPPTVGSLRGIDREVAQQFADAGYQVTVRACLAATSSEDSERPRFAPDGWGEQTAFARLRDGMVTPELRASLGPVHAFVPQNECSGDDGGGWVDAEPVSLAPHLMPELNQQWVIRSKAAATLLHETAFDEYGFFGNGGFEAYLYTLAALEVSK